MLALHPILLALQLLGAPAVVDGARDAHQRARAELTDVERGRAELAGRHEHLAGEIAALKSANAGPLLRGVADGRLDATLKEAQGLAEQLEVLDRRVADARDRAADARRALVAQLDAAIADQRQALAAAPPAQRRARFEALGRLVAERSRLTTSAPRASGGRVQLPDTADTEDPDALRELADETQDHAERVRGDLGRLDARLAALLARRRLVRAATAFERDTQLFGEDERSRRVARAEPGTATGRGVGNNREAAPGGQRGGANGDSEAEVATSDGVADEPGVARDAPEESPAPPPQAGGADSDGDDFAQGPQGPEDGAGLNADEVAPADPAPEAPEAVAVGSVADVAPEVDPGAAVVVDDVLDPGLLEGDLGGLSSGDVAAQIQQIKARRASLVRTADELDARQRALEEKARDLDH